MDDTGNGRGGTRMPPNSVSLDDSMMAVRHGNAGTMLTKEGTWESLFHQQGIIETQLRDAGERTSRNSAEGQQQARVLTSPHRPWLPPMLAWGALQGGKLGSLPVRDEAATA